MSNLKIKIESGRAKVDFDLQHLVSAFSLPNKLRTAVEEEKIRNQVETQSQKPIEEMDFQELLKQLILMKN